MLDSTFVFGTLELPTLEKTSSFNIESWPNSLGGEIIILITIILAILTLPKLKNLLPSIIGCLFRGKEILNLENSVKLARDLQQVYAICIIPFILIVCRFEIYKPSFLEGLKEELYIVLTIGIFCLYLALRYIFSLIKFGNINSHIYSAANHTFSIIFTALTLILLCTISILSMLNIDYEIIRIVITYEIILFFAINLLRKAQVFINYRGIFTAFLYLCTIEILPTSILVLSAILI